MDDKLTVEIQDADRWQWLKFAAPSILATLSLLWYLQDYSYEAAIALVSSCAVLGGVILAGGKMGLAFSGGAILGAMLSAVVAYKVPAINQHFGLGSEDSQKKISTLSEEIARLRVALRAAQNKDEGLRRNPVQSQGIAQEIAGKTMAYSGASSGVGEEAPPATSSNDDRVRIADNFSFELKGCERKDLDISCSFAITNLAEPRDLAIKYSSRIVDSKGISHRQCTRIFGDRIVKSGRYLTVGLPSGVPSELQIGFCRIAGVVDHISMLEVHAKRSIATWENPSLGTVSNNKN